ncbi:MAG: hypothetical protein ABIP21_10280, partial [Acidimicrobiia bacterium]
MNLTSRRSGPDRFATPPHPAVAEGESGQSSRSLDTTRGRDHSARSMVGLFLASYVALSVVMVGLGLLV